MTNKHAHKAVKARRTMRGWTTCVTPHHCAADPSRQIAHGNITYLDTCSCGAVRESEVNAGSVNYGTWQEQAA